MSPENLGKPRNELGAKESVIGTREILAGDQGKLESFNQKLLAIDIENKRAMEQAKGNLVLIGHQNTLYEGKVRALCEEFLAS